MSKRSKILELLTQNELTTKEIQAKLGYDLNLIQVYIHQFKNNGQIKKKGNKGKFIIYSAIEKEPIKIDKNLIKYLIFFNDFFKDNLEYLIKNKKIQDFVLNHKEFDEIEEVIQNG